MKSFNFTVKQLVSFTGKFSSPPAAPLWGKPFNLFQGYCNMQQKLFYKSHCTYK